MRWKSAALAAVALAGHAPTRAVADESGDPNAPAASGPAINRFNFRLGGATSDATGRPTLCLDVRIVKGLSVEGCGTGQGVIHDELGSEMAHFRGNYSFFEGHTSRGTGRVRGGIGFAELQVGLDRPGFHFGDPDAVDRGSVAGPEGAVQGQWLIPIGKGVEAIASFTAGVAIFASADKLIVPQSNVQPFASFEVGLGW